MNKQTARSLLMDFLYDEISTQDKENLELYLDKHPELFEELKELRKTQKLLKQMPEVEASRKLHMVEPRRRTFAQWRNDLTTLFPHSGWGKAGFAAAVCLLLLLITGAAASLQISSDENGFSLSLGYDEQSERPQINQTANPGFVAAQQPKTDTIVQNANVLTEDEARKFLTTDEAEILLTELQQQNEALLAAFAEEMNRQDEEQLQQIIKFFQAQRVYDLKRINQSLSQTQLANAYRWQQTNQVLGKIIQTASVEN